MVLVRIRNRFGIVLDLSWDHCGIILGLFWVHFGIISGPKTVQKWTPKRGPEKGTSRGPFGTEISPKRAPSHSINVTNPSGFIVFSENRGFGTQARDETENRPEMGPKRIQIRTQNGSFGGPKWGPKAGPVSGGVLGALGVVLGPFWGPYGVSSCPSPLWGWERARVRAKKRLRVSRPM